MYEPGEIAKSIFEIGKTLGQGSEKLFPMVRKKAETERDYRKALAIEILRLKSDGMPATLILDVARGNLADLKFERDMAEEMYKSARDRLDALEAEMNGLQSIFKRFEEV